MTGENMAQIVRLENWSVKHVQPEDIYKPPTEIRLSGEAYGHPAFADGESIDTSIVVGSTGRVVHCESRDYQLGAPAPEFVAWMAEQGLPPLDEAQPVKIIRE